MPVYRFPQNPLITPADVNPSVEGYEVVCAFNPGVIEFGDEILLLMRVAQRPVNNDSQHKVLVPMLSESTLKLQVVEFKTDSPGIDLSDSRVVTFPDALYLTSISHLQIARSRDGIHFTVDEAPCMFPETEYERYGIEDPRITQIDSTYYIVYKGVSATGITQCLASTTDFVNFKRHGIIFPPENMDAMLFPEKINGKYAAFHRPQPKMIGTPNMWLSWSEDLIHWGEHQYLLGCSSGTWEGGRIGGGAVPFRIDEGWLEIYHAATSDDHYCLGAVLLDPADPSRVVAKSAHPILAPEAAYETSGFKNNVVFTCGAVRNGEDVTIYYGAADEAICAARMTISDILESMDRS